MTTPPATTTLTEVNTAIDTMLVEVVDGWCSPEKAHAMSALVATTHPTLAVELGVFAGRSLFAQAIAMRAFGGGLLVGVDPWQREATVEGGVGAENTAWWSALDLHTIHAAFMGHLWRLGLADRCLVLRSTADAAAALFAPASIDIIHCDANHSEAMSCQDVRTWLPKLKPGGYFWMDDIHWETTQKAIGMLAATMLQVLDTDKCRLFRKPGGYQAGGAP